MPDKSVEFLQRLFDSQEMSPALRSSYQGELDAILHEPLTRRKWWGGIALLVLMVGLVIAEIYAMVVHPGSFLLYGAAGTMMIACGMTAIWIFRDLKKEKISRKSSYKVAEIFYGAAGLLLAMQMFHGLQSASDPKSTFGLLYLFVFLSMCANWGFNNRISAAELKVREQILRVECRLADLADQLKNNEMK